MTGILNTLSKKEYLYKRFEKTKVLVIDEVSMLSSRLFDSVERVCRAMKRSEEPFGGMQVVLSRIFQLPPISRERGDGVYTQVGLLEKNGREGLLSGRAVSA